MNYLQYLLFLLYGVSAFLMGNFIYRFLNKENETFLNRFVLAGETLLLGATVIYAEMLLLSMAGLYQKTFLWPAVIMNYFVLLDPRTRRHLKESFLKAVAWDVPLVVFLLLTAFFVFRNNFFLVDIDSHKTYLFTQKIWLTAGTSLVGNPATDITVFAPQFDAIPYGLGLSVFPKELLFPQLITIFWRLIALMLLFGYISYRFNRFYGLAAGMMMLFDEHFFFSGANAYVIVNGALIAFFFAAAYNFWEGRIQNSSFRFLLGLLFLSQLMSNKFQMAYCLLGMLPLALFIQGEPGTMVKSLFGNKRFLGAVLAASLITSLWFIKNQLVTGFFLFPIYAGKLGIWGWSQEKSEMFIKVLGNLDLMRFLKYMNYFFIWHGMKASKLIILAYSCLPFILLLSILRKTFNQKAVLELSYWLGLAFIVIAGICLGSYVDPRYYRYALGISIFAAILTVDFVFRYNFSVHHKWVLAVVILGLALPGYKIMAGQGGSFKWPHFQDNVHVMTDKMRTHDIIGRYYPGNLIIEKELAAGHVPAEKLSHSAWGYGKGDPKTISPFLSPLLAQVSFWLTSVVRWDSYEREDLIVQDLKNYGISWVTRVEGNEWKFLTPEEYAREAVGYDRKPRKMMYNYNFPRELAEVKY